MPAPSSTPTEAVVAEGASKSFGGVRALDGVSFALPAGELVGVAGANGSGKSTLLRLLAGILEADAGTVRVLGRHPRRERAALRREAGYAGQEAALDPEMTGWETLRLFHALLGLPHGERGRRLETAVEEHGLAEVCGRRVSGWSGGQRQRLHLALATLHAPRLVLLDEPTASLDPEGRRALWDRLTAWCREGRTVVVSTHDLAEVAAHCDRVLLFRGGRLLAAERPAALVAAHSRPRTVITLARAPDADAMRGALAVLHGVTEVAVRGETVTLWRDRHPAGAEPALELLAARGMVYRGYERREPELADAYFRLTGSAPDAERPARGRGGRRRKA